MRKLLESFEPQCVQFNQFTSWYVSGFFQVDEVSVLAYGDGVQCVLYMLATCYLATNARTLLPNK